MNYLLLLTSFIAGILTILAPCVLPLLPVIIGSTATSKNKWRPLIVTTSLALSVVIFTILLKTSSLLIEIPQSVWTTISGGIVLLFGIFLLIPQWWDVLSYKLRFMQRSQNQLAHAGTGESIGSSILIGAALGPVFSSCSPTYFVILATVLPVDFGTGIVYLLTYALGLLLILGLIAYLGQRLTARLAWAANPHGWFKRTMGILLILVSLLVISGLEKKIETAVQDAGFGVTGIEENLLSKIFKQDSRSLEETSSTELPYLGEAPELQGVANWINSAPISTMKDLRGKVVLIDFWTYSCINCIRTLPYLESWHERYATDGLVIIGVHAPEFQFEKKLENVERAVKEFGLQYPIVQDNNFSLWRAYDNHYWPAKYLIDKNGILRYTHFGEGKYDETEQKITELLGSKMISDTIDAESVSFSQIGTPETYIGLARRSHYATGSTPLQTNQWRLTGSWTEEDEKATTNEKGATISMKFHAAKANLVISGIGTATVYIDGELASLKNSGDDVHDSILQLDGERLYEIANFGEEYTDHLIEIIFDEAGISAFAWTFG